jgi:hypothetical protein
MLYVCEICKREFESQPEAATHEETCARQNQTAVNIVKGVKQMIKDAKAAGLNFGIYAGENYRTHCASFDGVEYDHERKAITVSFDT